MVRIATHPDYARMGYGSRAMEALESFYNGTLYSFDDAPVDIGESFADAAKVGPVSDIFHPFSQSWTSTECIFQNANLQNDTIAIRDPSRMPPLLQRLSERKPETLDYLGVSFGLTRDLLKFWKKGGFTPLYASQKENALTGEYTFVMLKVLASAGGGGEWLGAFAQGTSCLLLQDKIHMEND